MKILILMILSIFIYNYSFAKFDKNSNIKNITVKYSGFNNENIEYDLKSKSILAADKNSPLNKYFRSSDYSKVNYIDFNSELYESKDFRNWNFLKRTNNNKMNFNNNFEFLIYPNPVIEVFTLKVNSIILSDVNVVLTDLTRSINIELISLKQFKGNFNNIFDVSKMGIKSGVYYIILSSNNVYEVKQLIII